uniref:V-type proton ATPase subunit a n=1 Tax=Seriola lalandi dorsalis TaxID=1841481 RepID=A0A3B4YEI6_SERLL
RLCDCFEFDAVEAFMQQTTQTLGCCLGCMSNTASYLFGPSALHTHVMDLTTDSPDVLWMMVMRVSFSLRGLLGSVSLVVLFCVLTLTVSILLVMEGFSVPCVSVRVEFKSKFYSGTGYKFRSFSFSNIIHFLSALSPHTSSVTTIHLLLLL